MNSELSLIINNVKKDINNMRNYDENIYNILVKKGLELYENNEIEKSILYLTIGLKGYDKKKDDYYIIESKLKDIKKIYRSLTNKKDETNINNDLNNNNYPNINQSDCKIEFNENDLNNLENSENIIEYIKNILKKDSDENDSDENDSDENDSYENYSYEKDSNENHSNEDDLHKNGSNKNYSNENDLYEYSMDNSYETKNNFEFKNLSKKTFECYPGYYDQKKKLLDYFIYPILFNKLYNKVNNIIFHGYDENIKYNLTIASLAELVNLNCTTKLDFYKITDINLDNFLKRIKDINENNIIILYINNEEIFNSIKTEIIENKNILIMLSIENLSLIDKNKINNFIEIELDLPDNFERINYLLYSFLDRYEENYPDKLCNLYLNEDNLSESILKEFTEYKKMYLNNNINLLNQYPKITKIKYNDDNELVETLESIEEYKNRLIIQVKNILYIDPSDYIRIIKEIGQIDENMSYNMEILINYNEYIEKFTNKILCKYLKISEKLIDKKHISYINYKKICIFIHYISELLGPNVLSYRLDIINDRSVSNKTISNYGYCLKDLKNIIDNVTSLLAIDIINQKFIEIPIQKCIKSTTSCGTKEYNKCYNLSDTNNNTSYFDIQLNSDESSLYVRSGNNNIYDIYCFIKFKYFIDVINKYKSSIADNDDYIKNENLKKIMKNFYKKK